MASIFNVKESVRVEGVSYFAEVFTVKGPEILADPQNQTFTQLYGYDWMGIVERSGLIKFFQWDGDDWQASSSFQRSGDLRRFSFAFDQSANIIFAYELGGVTYVTRWDVTTSQYVEDISFSALHPVLYNDVLTNGFVGDSDVICFYVDGTTVLKQRFQRDDFDTEYNFIPDVALPSGFIIDRVITLGNRWQVLASDALGVPLELMPTSDRYPLYVSVPPVSGRVAVGANLRSVVKTYVPTVPTVEGSVSTGAIIRSIVQTYAATIPTVEGSVSTGAILTTIAEQYATTVPTVTGSVSTGAILTTV
jgi:hypothetical protein